MSPISLQSLSPRPERLIRTIWSASSVGAILSASATACADSSAGMMPSVRHSVISASSASASLQVVYRTRRVSFQWLCSGPTPG